MSGTNTSKLSGGFIAISGNRILLISLLSHKLKQRRLNSRPVDTMDVLANIVKQRGTKPWHIVTQFYLNSSL